MASSTQRRTAPADASRRRTPAQKKKAEYDERERSVYRGRRARPWRGVRRDVHMWLAALRDAPDEHPAFDSPRAWSRPQREPRLPCPTRRERVAAAALHRAMFAGYGTLYPKASTHPDVYARYAAFLRARTADLGPHGALHARAVRALFAGTAPHCGIYWGGIDTNAYFAFVLDHTPGLRETLLAWLAEIDRRHAGWRGGVAPRITRH